MTTITPDDYLNGDIIAALKILRSLVEIIEYQKIESDEFLKLPELGICFHADNSGEISDIRIYLKEADGFFAAEDNTVGVALIGCGGRGTGGTGGGGTRGGAARAYARRAAATGAAAAVRACSFAFCQDSRRVGSV